MQRAFDIGVAKVLHHFICSQSNRIIGLYEMCPISIQIIVTGGSLKDCQEALDLAKTNGIDRISK